MTAAPTAPPASTATTEPALARNSVERAARRFTVRVRNRTCLSLGTGSGTLVGERYLVTNRHVVEGAFELGLDTWDGRSLEAGVASSATIADLALVELEAPVEGAATLREPRVQDGEPVTVVGFPEGGQLTFAEGVAVDHQVSGAYDTTEAVLRFDAPVRPGNSGGPLLDGDGEVVGIVFAVETATGYGLAVPARVVTELLETRSGLEPVRACADP